MIREFKVDNLLVREFKSRDELGEEAAIMVSGRIIELLKKQPFVNIIFAAAPSQNEFLAALCKKELDWRRINAFHMDEYIGLSKDAPQGFGNFLKTKLFDYVPFCSVHYLNGNVSTFEAECNRYKALLQLYPADIVCMGIGENGHIAFNDPPVADFNDPEWVKMVELDETCRQQQVNDGCFPEINDVPTRALTLTIPALMSARYVYCVVPGASKANAVYNTLNSPVYKRNPSSIIRKHPNAILFLDSLSTVQLSKNSPCVDGVNS